MPLTLDGWTYGRAPVVLAGRHTHHSCTRTDMTFFTSTASTKELVVNIACGEHLYGRDERHFLFWHSP